MLSFSTKSKTLQNKFATLLKQANIELEQINIVFLYYVIIKDDSFPFLPFRYMASWVYVVVLGWRAAEHERNVTAERDFVELRFTNHSTCNRFAWHFLSKLLFNRQIRQSSKALSANIRGLESFVFACLHDVDGSMFHH